MRTRPQTSLERWAIDPVSIELFFLREALRDRRIYEHGSYGRRFMRKAVVRRIARIRAFRAGGFPALAGIA